MRSGLRKSDIYDGNSQEVLRVSPLTRMRILNDSRRAPRHVPIARFTRLIMRDCYEALANGGAYGSKTAEVSVTMRSHFSSFLHVL